MTVDENRLEILQMIKDGRITPEEGVELLKAIEPSGAIAKLEDAEQYAFTVDEGEEGMDEEDKPKKKPKFLVIQVSEGGKKKVNVKIPLKLARLASRFIPKSAQAHMKAEGVELNLNEILSTLEQVGCCEDIVNVVDNDKGEVVRIYCCE